MNCKKTEPGVPGFEQPPLGRQSPSDRSRQRRWLTRMAVRKETMNIRGNASATKALRTLIFSAMALAVLVNGWGALSRAFQTQLADYFVAIGINESL